MTVVPVPVETDGEVIGYECPDCGTVKTTAKKAARHCKIKSTDTNVPTEEWVPKHVSDINEGVWSTLTEEMTSLMCAPRGGKNAFGPEGEKNHPDAPCTGADCLDEVETTDDPRCQCDARYKWTYPENWMEFETARKWAEMDPTLSDAIMVVHQREGEAYRAPADRGLVIDGDNVVDMDGTVHPDFRDVVHELTDDPGYVSLSSSQHGAHVPSIGRLPDGVKQLKIPLSLDVEGFDTSHVDEDEGIHIDLFDGKHLRKATGMHVDGTPRQPATIETEALAQYCKECGASLTATITESNEEGTSVERDVTVEATAEYTGPDPENWTIPEDRCLEYHAAVEAHYHGHSTGNFWRVTGAAAAWGQRLGKSPEEIIADLRGEDRPGTSVGFGGKTERRVHTDWKRAANGAFAPHSHAGLAKIGVLPPRYATRGDTKAGKTRQYTSEACIPPKRDAQPFDCEQQWTDLQGDRYQEWLDHHRGPMIWGDLAGTGKTTNAGLAAATRNRPHFIAFDKHAKAHEFIADSASPDDYFHLKGASQPKHDCCMDAIVGAGSTDTPVCPEHGHPANWPHMCPIYDRDTDDPLRQRYDALAETVGAIAAHLILGLFEEDHGWHGDRCLWARQFDELADESGTLVRERVVGVHEYQLLDSAMEGRDSIVDESPRSLDSESRVTVEELIRTANRLEMLADLPHATEEVNTHLRDNLVALAAFVRDCAEAIVSDTPGDLSEIDAPDLTCRTYRATKDPMSGAYTKYRLLAETLARLKLEYSESTIRRIQNDEWNGEPLCMDTIIAAAAAAGFDNNACRKAIAAPVQLTHCPWCNNALDAENGARCCSECGWDERENTITRQDGPHARAVSWIEDDHRNLDDEDGPALCARILPPVEEFNDPLILDATAAPEKIAGLYGARIDDVPVRGGEPFDLDGKLRTVQVVGGQHGPTDQSHVGGQYHASTIKTSESVQQRIQSTIDNLCQLHEHPLFGIKRALIPLFEWPANAEVLHYGGARGLNRTECDAVCCIGAPHPKMDAIERTAKLLAQGHPDLRVGGEEFSTRRNEDGELAANPPVYRKLHYEDENGDGLAVPTKAFSGLVGVLFREAREMELVQFVHRIRPLLVEEDEPMKHAYLLTDVPTDLPIDDVIGFEELADPLKAMLPVPDGAIRLLGYGRDVLNGNTPAGFRASALVERRTDGTLANKASGWNRLARLHGENVTQRTVYNWLNALEDIGLIIPTEYEHRAGVSFTADCSTLKMALSLLHSNAAFNVAAVRRFVREVRAADGSLDWLTWAHEVFALSGDRCGLDLPSDSTN